MTEYTELQKYILKNMISFQRFEKNGVSVYSWYTDYTADTLDLPLSFQRISSLKFDMASAWVDMDNTFIATWRNIPMADKPMVLMYKFDDHGSMMNELKIMVSDPQRWLTLGGEM